MATTTPYEKRILYGLVGGVLLIIAFYLLVSWSIDELWFIKLIILFACLVLGLALLAVQFGMFEE